MSSDLSLKFYLTPEHECSYLKDQEARTLFVDPRTALSTDSFARLTENGFRRSGDYVYRPHCEQCQACESLRVIAPLFEFSKYERRIWTKNLDLEANFSEPRFDQSHYALYERYIEARHQDGDMYPPSEEQYKNFLLTPFESAQFIEFFLDGELVALSVVDRLTNALSAIYTFFDPELSKRSLGTFVILWQLNYCQVEKLDYLYLGYYIAQSHKMAYKKRFGPSERFRNNQWLTD